MKGDEHAEEQSKREFSPATRAFDHSYRSCRGSAPPRSASDEFRAHRGFGAFRRRLFFQQARGIRDSLAVAHRGRRVYGLPPVDSLHLFKFPCERDHWLLATPKKIRASRRGSNGGGH